MGFVLLGIDVPHKRPFRPLGAHEGVLATHEIEIASPQQLVIAGLFDKRQDPNGQRAAFDDISPTQFVKAENRRNLWQNPTFRNKTGHRKKSLPPTFEQLCEAGVFI